MNEVRELNETVEYLMDGRIEQGKIISIAMKNKYEVMLYEISKDHKTESNLVPPENLI